MPRLRTRNRRGNFSAVCHHSSARVQERPALRFVQKIQLNQMLKTMNTNNTISAQLEISAARVQDLVASEAARSMRQNEATIKAVEGDAERTVVTGSVHDVMRVIGVLADHGESCLLSVFSVDHTEALEAATAYVELYTGNGTRKQPPQWAMDDEGQFLAQVIADRGRAAALHFQA